MDDLLPNGRERTGIVENGEHRREVHGGNAYKPPVILTPSERQAVSRMVDERVKAEVDAIVARAVEVRDREISAVAMPPPSVEIKTILLAVTEATGVSTADMQGPRRMRRLAWPRHLAMHLVRDLRPDLSYPSIGRIFGGRDHTTIMAALERIEQRRNDPPYVAWFAHPAIVALYAEKAAREIGR